MTPISAGLLCCARVWARGGSQSRNVSGQETAVTFTIAGSSCGHASRL